MPCASRASGRGPTTVPDRHLASRNRGELDTALAAVSDVARRATSLGIDRVVLEPGVVPRAAGPEEAGPGDLAEDSVRWTPEAAAAKKAIRDKRLEGALDVACRALHRICAAHPEVTFCLGPSRHVSGLGEVEALSAIFEDLGRSCRLAYWHDTAIAYRRQCLLGEPEGAWLESFAPRLAGVTLADADPDGRLHLPPGAGLVDFPLLATYVAKTGVGGRAPCRVVELQPDVEPGEIPGVHSFLAKYGL
jgi:sugar phosphate isomerase/epimerase